MQSSSRAAYCSPSTVNGAWPRDASGAAVPRTARRFANLHRASGARMSVTRTPERPLVELAECGTGLVRSRLSEPGHGERTGYLGLEQLTRVDRRRDQAGHDPAQGGRSRPGRAAGRLHRGGQGRSAPRPPAVAARHGLVGSGTSPAATSSWRCSRARAAPSGPGRRYRKARPTRSPRWTAPTAKAPRSP